MASCVRPLRVSWFPFVLLHTQDTSPEGPQLPCQLESRLALGSGQALAHAGHLHEREVHTWPRVSCVCHLCWGCDGREGRAVILSLRFLGSFTYYFAYMAQCTPLFAFTVFHLIWGCNNNFFHDYDVFFLPFTVFNAGRKREQVKVTSCEASHTSCLMNK